MKLEEIDMDLPYKKNFQYIKKIKKKGCVGNEATIQDYNINWKDKRKKFQLMTRCMTSMVERLMNKIITNDCWKIVIECVEGKPEDGYKNMLGVYIVQIPICLDEFWQLGNYEIKKWVVAKIKEGIEKLSSQVDFDVSNIQNACEEIHKNNYNNVWYWKKPNKRKETYVQIMIEHEVDRVNVYMVFFDILLNPIDKILLVSDLPQEYKYAVYLGQVKWESDNSAILISKDGRIYRGYY